jgi:hypothetical protein
VIRLIRFFGLGVALLILSGCGSETREIRVITQVPVRNLQNLSNGLLSTPSGLSGGPLGGLPTSAYCLQGDIRVLFLDQRPGYQPLFRKVNLITARADPANSPWNSPNNGAKGLGDAINWISQNSFLREPLVIPVPRDSGGVVRIIGSFVYPGSSDQNPTCSRLDAGGDPYDTFTLWGEAPLSPGGSLSVNLPINMISSVATPATGITGTVPYSTPALIGGGVVATPTPTPPGGVDLSIKCKNYSNRLSCMNRGLMEIKFMPNFFNGTVIPAFIPIRYGGGADLEPITKLFTINTGSLTQNYFYLPRARSMEFEYYLRSQPNDSASDQKTIKVQVDWGGKRYSYFNPFTNTSQDFSLVNCTGNIWGIRLPAKSTPNTISPPDCANDLPNVFVTDLGAGFN